MLTVDDDITLLEVRHELIDEGVDSGPSLDKENDLARALELGAELFNRVRANDVGACVSG